MPQLYVNKQGEIRHSDDIQDIITAVPSWVLRWGITVFFVAIVLVLSLSAFIKYPDIVKTQLVIQSPDAAKPVVAKVPGKLIKLLIKDGQLVDSGQTLAYLESTGSHKAIIDLNVQLKIMQHSLITDDYVDDAFFEKTKTSNLGELQKSFETFFQAYIDYKSTVTNGFLSKKRVLLEDDLKNLKLQDNQLNEQKSIDSADYKLAAQEYEMHQRLIKEQVETKAEFRQAESKFLGKKSPLVQTEGALITSKVSVVAKKKELLEIEHQIKEQKAKFLQSLNSLISEVNDWQSKYVVSSTESGLLSFVGVVQEKEVVAINQELFYINPKNDHFFGEMNVPQNNMGKIKIKQRVLIKLKSYPFEEYGVVHGNIDYIADVPIKDSVFLSKVTFDIKDRTDMRKEIHMKQGMLADAEIITEDASVLGRISRNMLKLINKN